MIEWNEKLGDALWQVKGLTAKERLLALFIAWNCKANKNKCHLAVFDIANATRLSFRQVEVGLAGLKRKKVIDYYAEDYPLELSALWDGGDAD